MKLSARNGLCPLIKGSYLSYLSRQRLHLVEEPDYHRHVQRRLRYDARTTTTCEESQHSRFQKNKITQDTIQSKADNAFL